MTFIKIIFSLNMFSRFGRAPDSAPLKSKMIYASSKDAIKRKFEGESQSMSVGTILVCRWLNNK